MTQYFCVIILATLFGLPFLTDSDSDYVLTIKKGIVTKQGKQTYWIVPATLTNKTKDTLRYFSMSCSWQDFYSVDNTKLQIQRSACDKNVPIIQAIPPGQNAAVDIRLIVNQAMVSKEIDFKIGFNLMKVNSGQDPLDFKYKEEQEKKNVVWSNSISM